MKIYTKTGDDGTTGLFGGGRVRKDDLRVETYGTVDELNAILGVARAAGQDAALDAILGELQHDLFVVGADLATPLRPEGDKPWVQRLPEGAIQRLEQHIDRCDGELPPLKNFILPGGTAQAAHLHHARTVCRRAERLVVGLQESAALTPSVLPWINRLSDLLFVLGRWANHRAEAPEILWAPRGAGESSDVV